LKGNIKLLVESRLTAVKQVLTGIEAQKEAANRVIAEYKAVEEKVQARKGLLRRIPNIELSKLSKF